MIDETNLAISSVVGLYGVPDSLRAARELTDIKEGELVFFYTTDSKRIYGVYRTRSLAFTEDHPEQGPWTRRAKDKRFKFYPFRIEIEPVKAYKKSVGWRELRKFGRGLTHQRIRRGSSVIMVDDRDTEKLLRLLVETNRNSI